MAVASDRVVNRGKRKIQSSGIVQRVAAGSKVKKNFGRGSLDIEREPMLMIETEMLARLIVHKGQQLHLSPLFQIIQDQKPFCYQYNQISQALHCDRTQNSGVNIWQADRKELTVPGEEGIIILSECEGALF